MKKRDATVKSGISFYYPVASLKKLIKR